MKRWLAGGLLGLSMLCGPVLHAEAERSWHSVKQPKAGPAESIGGYSSGCIRGARRLPPEGKGYYVMKPSRGRMYGHPELIAFITRFARKVRSAGLSPLLLGDLGQPRGGPAPSGHASHQTGLDVDIWYASPDDLEASQLALPAREQVEALNMVQNESKLSEHYSPRVEKLLRIAASDEKVARIFVNPVIKQALCERPGEREYLHKLRPWWGHDEHFHVRLACPPESASCESQPEVEAGDGCAELREWLSPEAQAERAQERAKYRARQGKAPQLPEQCLGVLK